MKENKKYTVEEFCKQYDGFGSSQLKENFVKSIMNPHYVPYEKKIAICEKIIESSYYKTTEIDGVTTRKLHVNSPTQYILYHLYLVKEYTHIDVKFNNVLEEFNLLNKSDVIDLICGLISEKEYKEFRVLLDMIESDVMQNEYETHAFITGQVERFADLFGHVALPALEKIGEALDNMDESTIDKFVNKLKGLNLIK